MAFEASVYGGGKCETCKGSGKHPVERWWKFLDCPICRGHGRYPMMVDIRGYKPPGTITNLPHGFDMTYDVLKGDPPDNRSPMIRLLDDPAWRESLKVAETPVEAEYRALRDRLEAQRPAPSTWSSSRTGESLGWGGWGL